MGKTYLKRLTTLIISFGIILSLLTIVDINNVKAEGGMETTDDSFYVLDDNGNPVLINPSEEDKQKLIEEEKNEKYNVIITDGENKEIIDEFDSYEQAEKSYKTTKNMIDYPKNSLRKFTRSNNNLKVQLTLNDEPLTISNTYNIVKFKRQVEYNSNGKSYVKNIKYTELDTNREGYINPSSIADAAYIRKEGNYYICKMGGVVIKVHENEVASTPTYQEALKADNISYYYVSGDKLTHRYSYYSNATTIKVGSTTVGYKPSYLSAGKNYYSYDGHYFYESFEKMIDDYRNNGYNNAINKNNPYYNYYQFLSLRTKSNFTSNQINERIANYINKNNKGKSVISGKGQSYITAQNNYGVNAGIMFGISANESAYGTSDIAKNKNNIFGLNAVDSSPGESANYFKSVDHCINEFASHWMSNGYLDALDSRYRGPHLGDKSSGMNVKYASDPYWGEKAAAANYSLDTAKTDYGRYTIGIAKTTALSIYNNPTKSSKLLYTSEATGDNGKMYNYPVIVLETVTGNDGQKWYKIQSDVPLNAARTERDRDAKYNYARDYAYVLASEIDVVFNGNGNIDVSGTIRGDVNGNGKVDAADYLMIMDSIIGKYQMNDNQKSAGDVNNNEKIDAADYLMVMDCILGKIRL